MKNPWVIIGVIVVVLICGSVWYSSTVSKTANEGIVISPKIIGPETSTVTLVEYSDFQCPACGQFQPVVEEVLAEYGDKMKFEYKHFPLVQIHPFANPAAIAAEAAAQQGKFFEFASLLFKNQAVWTKGGNPGPFFAKYAEELGLDVEKFTKDQRSSIIKDHVKAQFDEARAAGLTGTPSFFLNGTKMEISTLDDFKAQIAAAVNPNVDFTVDGNNPPLKVIPVEGEASGAVAVPAAGGEMNNTSAEPPVQFGI